MRWNDDYPTGAAVAWPLLIAVAIVTGLVVSLWDTVAGVLAGLVVFVGITAYVYVQRHEP